MDLEDIKIKDVIREVIKEILDENLEIYLNRANDYMEVELYFDGDVIDSDSVDIS